MSINPHTPKSVLLIYGDGTTLMMSIAGRNPEVHGVVWGAAKGNLKDNPPPYVAVDDTDGNEYPSWVTCTPDPATLATTVPPTCYWEDGQLVCCDTMAGVPAGE